MVSRIDPLSILYNTLNSKLGKEDEDKIRILVGGQISKRDLEKLQNPAEIFKHLEEHGHIGRDDLDFLKEVLKTIDRPPLIKFVEECEESLETYHGMPRSKIPRLSSGHNAGYGEASSVTSLAPTHRDMATATPDLGGDTKSQQDHKESIADCIKKENR
ncbi:FAS-associated death domain protein-like [Ptychodera flava]|uniref:FAS-associated death domain protein-like n=1 Tax=Ptychodera flava TaxID=63121 RepID=UPI00396A96A9